MSEHTPFLEIFPGCADLAARMEVGCLRQLLAAEADRAAER